jgi:hypothetical protein
MTFAKSSRRGTEIRGGLVLRHRRAFRITAALAAAGGVVGSVAGVASFVSAFVLRFGLREQLSAP